MNFQRNLKEIREIKNITQYEMAEKLNIDINKYRYIEQETKKAKTINFELLEQIKNILQCTYDDLLK